MFRIIPIFIVVILLGGIGFAITQPNTFHVERALRMQATPQQIYPLISDFSNWHQWSPWVAKDPNIDVTLSAQSSAMGAIYEWSGNQEVGEGKIEIVTLQPDTSARFKLTIYEPYNAENVVLFTLKPFGDYTKVTWEVTGPLDFVSKLFNVINSMDSIIGPDFEIGLGRMKTAAESRS